MTKQTCCPPNSSSGCFVWLSKCGKLERTLVKCGADGSNIFVVKEHNLENWGVSEKVVCLVKGHALWTRPKVVLRPLLWRLITGEKGTKWSLTRMWIRTGASDKLWIKLHKSMKASDSRNTKALEYIWSYISNRYQCAVWCSQCYAWKWVKKGH